MYGISQTLSAFQHAEILQSKDRPLPSSANMAVDFGKVASKIFSTVASWSCPSGLFVLMFYLPCWNSQEFVAEHTAAKKMYKDQVNSMTCWHDSIMARHAPGFQWSWGDLLPSLTGSLEGPGALWVTTEPTEEPMTLKPKHEEVFLAEILVPWWKVG